MELPLRLGRMWWAGFKVFCGWCALGIVLWILWIPVALLMSLVGANDNEWLAMALMILVGPILFYFASRYLCLLGDGGQAAPQEECAPTATDALARRDKSLKTKIAMSVGVVFLSGVFLSPPDVLTALSLGLAMVFLCAVPLLILARFDFMKSASSSMQTLVCVLVCIVAILSGVCLLFGPRMFSR